MSSRTMSKAQKKTENLSQISSPDGFGGLGRSGRAMTRSLKNNRPRTLEAQGATIVELCGNRKAFLTTSRAA